MTIAAKVELIVSGDVDLLSLGQVREHSDRRAGTDRQGASLIELRALTGRQLVLPSATSIEALVNLHLLVEPHATDERDAYGEQNRNPA